MTLAMEADRNRRQDTMDPARSDMRSRTGATPAPTMAPLRSCNPRPSRYTAGSARTDLLALFAGPGEARLAGTSCGRRPGCRTASGMMRWRAGVVADTQAPASSDARLKAAAGQAHPPRAAGRGDVTLLFRPDPHLWDGRFANNAWLQELPRPLTKLTWDNPLLVSPAIARPAGAGERRSCVGARSAAPRMTLPAWVMPGQAADCAVALLGFGRTDVGMVGQGIGCERLSTDRRHRPRHAAQSRRARGTRLHRAPRPDLRRRR